MFLILFLSTFQLMGCVNNFLDEASFVVVCVNCIFYCLFDLFQLLLFFIPMYFVLVYMVFRQFSRLINLIGFPRIYNLSQFLILQIYGHVKFIEQMFGVLISTDATRSRFR